MSLAESTTESHTPPAEACVESHARCSRCEHFVAIETPLSVLGLAGEALYAELARRATEACPRCSAKKRAVAAA